MSDKKPAEVIQFRTTDEDIKEEDFTIKGDPPKTLNAGIDFGKSALALFPLTPVPFKGEGAFWSYTRIALYGTAGYLAWGRARRLSYILFTAAGLSAAVSTTATAWNGGKK